VVETQEHRLSSATRASFNRSKVTNGSLGIRLTSSAGRRFKDLIEEYGKEVAGTDELSSAEVALVRMAAGITVRCEALQSAIVSGDPVDDNVIIRLTNAGCRILLALTKARTEIGRAHV
jgi:hypothetical protein